MKIVALKKIKFKKYKPFLPWVLVLLFIFIILFLVFSTNDKEKEAKRLVQAVGKLVILPNNEVPTIATVTDLSKLQGQLFFKNAKIGDKVLIYFKSQKAILYSPDLDKVIEIAPLNVVEN